MDTWDKIVERMESGETLESATKDQDSLFESTKTKVHRHVSRHQQKAIKR